MAKARVRWSVTWLMSLCFIGVVHNAAAQQRMQFDLPSQALESALSTFGELTGYSVLVATQFASQRRSTAVNGEFTPPEALLILLSGTGLVVKYAGEQAVTLLPDSQLAPVANDAPRQSVLIKAHFSAALQRDITRALCLADKDGFGRYRLAFQLWINQHGRIDDVRLLASTGIEGRDVLIKGALRHIVMQTMPPPDLPQPLTMLLTPRSDPNADCRSNSRYAD